MSNRLGWIALCAALCLLGSGAWGLYAYSTHRAPVTLTYAQFVRQNPAHGWYRVTGGFMDLTTSLEETGKNGEHRQYYAALRSMTENPANPVQIVVAPNDPAIAATMGEIIQAGQVEHPTPRQIADFMTTFKNRAFVPGNVEGMVDADVDSSMRAKLGQRMANLAPGYTLIELGRRPSVNGPLACLIAGALAAVIGVALMRRRRPTRNAEAA